MFFDNYIYICIYMELGGVGRHDNTWLDNGIKF